jgi:hypothetical protein
VKSGAANPTPKLTSIVAGMAAGADSIDDLDVIRSGGMKQLFGGVYACATLGIFLREFSHGHVRQGGVRWSVYKILGEGVHRCPWFKISGSRVGRLVMRSMI